MTKRKSISIDPEIQKTITPIGQDVPKGGIPIDSISAKSFENEGAIRAVTGKKNQPSTKGEEFGPEIRAKKITISDNRIGIKGDTFHKEDIPIEPKIGPKQITNKLPEILPEAKLTIKMSDKKK